jgi:micrococcal nuclease
MAILRITLGLGILIAIPAGAAPLDEADLLAALPAVATARVAAVADGGTLTLYDGQTVRLAAIEVPLPPLGHAADTPWSWADAAKDKLAALLEGHETTVRGAAAAPDRYGRLVAEIVRDDGLWLEAALVEQGAVRVETTPDTAALAPALLKREAAARRQGLGLWQARFYAVRTPAELEHESGSFQIVETVIRKVENRHGIVWLDLGNDASARLERPARKAFEMAGLDPRTLAGSAVRLRGWVEWQGRPVLELTHPEALEKLRGGPEN